MFLFFQFSNFMENVEKEAVPHRQFNYDKSIFKLDGGSKTYEISMDTPNAKKYIVLEEYDIEKISNISPSLR